MSETVQWIRNTVEWQRHLLPNEIVELGLWFEVLAVFSINVAFVAVVASCVQNVAIRRRLSAESSVRSKVRAFHERQMKSDYPQFVHEAKLARWSQSAFVSFGRWSRITRVARGCGGEFIGGGWVTPKALVRVPLLLLCGFFLIVGVWPEISDRSNRLLPIPSWETFTFDSLSQVLTCVTFLFGAVALLARAATKNQVRAHSKAVDHANERLTRLAPIVRKAAQLAWQRRTQDAQARPQIINASVRAATQGEYEWLGAVRKVGYSQISKLRSVNAIGAKEWQDTINELAQWHTDAYSSGAIPLVGRLLGREEDYFDIFGLYLDGYHQPSLESIEIALNGPGIFPRQLENNRIPYDRRVLDPESGESFEDLAKPYVSSLMTHIDLNCARLHLSALALNAAHDAIENRILGAPILGKFASLSK